MKLANYKRQDVTAKREWNEEEYITMDDFTQLYIECKQKCPDCDTPLERSIENGSVISNISIDRLDNSLAHVKKNCRMCCITCNCKKSDK